MSAFREFVKRLPGARAAWRAVRPRSRGERIEDRDRALTARVLDRVLTTATNTADVGANVGDVAADLSARGPAGRHFAFEPLPALAAAVRRRVPGTTVEAVAVSDVAGEATFHHVVAHPAFSGLARREDLPAAEVVEAITVRTARLDDLIPADCRIGLLKIDVEGGELGVLRGAERVLGRDRPWVLFEHGGDGTTTADVFAEFARHGLAVWLMEDWLAGRPALTPAELGAVVAAGDHWNFWAGPVGSAGR